MEIHYRENRVTPSEVAKYRKDLREALSERRMGRWYAYRHHAQLLREQNQGYHHGYFRMEGKLGCTCGLIVEENEDFLALGKDGFDFEPLMHVAGHRNLPSCEGETVALIVGFVFDPEPYEYLWRSFCQVCETYFQGLTNEEAQVFVEYHNDICGGGRDA